MQQPTELRDCVFARIVCECGEYQATLPSLELLPERCHWCESRNWLVVTKAEGLTRIAMPHYSKQLKVAIRETKEEAKGAWPRTPANQRGGRPPKAKGAGA